MDAEAQEKAAKNSRVLGEKEVHCFSYHYVLGFLPVCH